AGGIAAALFQRERTGKGMVVDTALLNFAVWQLGVDLTATTILREEPQKMTQGVARSSNPLVGPYSTRDGRYLILNMPADPRHWPPLCRALGLDALIDDPRYVDTAARAENNVALYAEISEAIRSHDLADLSVMLKKEDTIFSALQSPLEAIDDP